MKRRRGKLALLVLLVALFLGACWSLVSSSNEYHRCLCEARNSPNNRSVTDLLKTHAGCVGAFLETHNGGITALATLLMAIFTIQLAVATGELKDISARQIESADALERPWLIIEKVRVERREGAPINPELYNNWYVSFFWRNVGRSPALIQECLFNIVPADELAEKPDYLSAGKLMCASSVAVGGEFETGQVGPGDQKRTKNGEAVQLTIYGRLTYKGLQGPRLYHTGFAINVSPHLPAQSSNPKQGYEYFD